MRGQKREQYWGDNIEHAFVVVVKHSLKYSEVSALYFFFEKSQLNFPKLSGKQMGKQWKQCQPLFWWAPKSLQMVIAAMKLKDACSLEEKL